ncbi:glutathione S-transferase [Aspergillus eucalypticola CBS 122712]|uniref:Glutathione S-transferase n=1 Tax=Aspergillus eucalypticola (strain CBS 122712 / IBT 29274) TaxID=1448314 RepID=A0A317V420_ASPEC|nr:glutathione S-transferase [Aspergillus eucalypticola CBS 122712]PWY68825.1 glutathione S-transferase [Aspergillus eucalypticola CBS 122712]
MESHHLSTVPDTKIHFTIIKAQTSSSSTPLLLFLHYWGGSSSTWHKQTSLTSPHTLSNTYNTVAIDLRGWGQSTGPAESSKDYSVTPMASDVALVLSHLQRTTSLIDNGVILIGHSMGAKVTLATLSKLSGSLLSLIKGLVLVAPAPPTPLILPAEMSEQQRKAYDNEASVRWTVENVLSSTQKISSEDMNMVIKDSLTGSILARDGWILHGMQENITSALDEVSTRLAGRKVRVSVLAGAEDIVENKDRVEKEVIGALAQRAFEVHFEVLEGVKHLIPLENPEGIARAIRSVVA